MTFARRGNAKPFGKRLSSSADMLPPLYFPSVCDRWFGEGFLRGRAHGLLECWLDPEPVVAVAEAVHADVAS